MEEPSVDRDSAQAFTSARLHRSYGPTEYPTLIQTDGRLYLFGGCHRALRKQVERREILQTKLDASARTSQRPARAPFYIGHCGRSPLNEWYQPLHASGQRSKWSAQWWP
jgi:hypothetical protein